MRERNLKPDIGYLVGRVRAITEELERIEVELRNLKRCSHCKGEAYGVTRVCNCDEVGEEEVREERDR